MRCSPCSTVPPMMVVDDRGSEHTRARESAASARLLNRAPRAPPQNPGAGTRGRRRRRRRSRARRGAARPGRRGRRGARARRRALVGARRNSQDLVSATQARDRTRESEALLPRARARYPPPLRPSIHLGPEGRAPLRETARRSRALPALPRRGPRGPRSTGPSSTRSRCGARSACARAPARGLPRVPVLSAALAAAARLQRATRCRQALRSRPGLSLARAAAAREAAQFALPLAPAPAPARRDVELVVLTPSRRRCSPRARARARPPQPRRHDSPRLSRRGLFAPRRRASPQVLRAPSTRGRPPTGSKDGATPAHAFHTTRRGSAPRPDNLPALPGQGLALYDLLAAAPPGAAAPALAPRDARARPAVARAGRPPRRDGVAGRRPSAAGRYGGRRRLSRWAAAT